MLGLASLSLPVNRLILWHKGGGALVVLSLIVLVIGALLWSMELSRHSYTLLGQAVFKWGIGLFILREVMLFFRFFWTYLHFSLNPTGDCGFIWPRYGIISLDAFSIPALNTLLLLSRGCFLTAAHHAVIVGYRGVAVKWWIITIVLGVVFMTMQGYEYAVGTFTFRAGTFGSIFYLGTGFHGIHVCAGLVLLLIAGSLNTTSLSHTMLELGAWYWHFVDVVWLGLFTLFYWWL